MHCPCSPRHAYCGQEHQMVHWEKGHYESHDENNDDEDEEDEEDEV